MSAFHLALIVRETLDNLDRWERDASIAANLVDTSESDAAYEDVMITNLTEMMMRAYRLGLLDASQSPHVTGE